MCAAHAHKGFSYSFFHASHIQYSYILEYPRDYRRLPYMAVQQALNNLKSQPPQQPKQAEAAKKKARVEPDGPG